MASDLVHIVDEVDQLTPDDEPFLLTAFDGFLDAGKAAGRAAEHLYRVGEGPVVATLDVDAFYDYRARRPPITFAQDHYEGFEAPRLVVRLLHDAERTPYLLLTGPEPDNRWEAFARAVREVVTRFRVRRVVQLASVPMAVPHTRPIAITPHGNRPELVHGRSPWRSELRVPSSAQSLLEVRLGEWGHDAQGFVAHVPHYIAQLEYPKASVSLLQHASAATGLVLDLDALVEDARSTEEDIAEHLAENPDVNEVVAGLEQQYDAFRRAEDEGHNLLAEDEPLPTSDEIGEQVEQFLAGLRGDHPEGPDHPDD